jgi:hypothetical protein
MQNSEKAVRNKAAQPCQKQVGPLKSDSRGSARKPCCGLAIAAVSVPESAGFPWVQVLYKIEYLDGFG